MHLFCSPFQLFYVKVQPRSALQCYNKSPSKFVTIFENDQTEIDTLSLRRLDFHALVMTYSRHRGLN